MARKKKVKTIPKIPCSHCLVWQTSKRMLDGGSVRLCQHIGEDILGDEERGSSCEHFQMSNYFWCDRSQQRISVKICVDRRKHSVAECKRCKYALLIEEVKRRENGQIDTSWRTKPKISWRVKGEKESEHV